MERVYMAITADKYELPLGVYDKVKDAAKAFGMKENSVSWELSTQKCQGEKRGFKFIKIMMD